MTAITLKQAADDLLVNIQLGIATALVGPVGVGKTDIVRQAVDKMTKLTGKTWNLIDKRASQMDASDWSMPMPNQSTKLVDNYTPGWLPNVARDGEFGILLLDDYFEANPAVMAPGNQLLLERAIGDYRLPDGWQVIVTGNRSSDRAAAQKISRATSNRLAIIEIMVDVQSWLDHAAAIGVSAELIAYIAVAHSQNVGAQALHRYPTQAGSDAMAFVTPRSLVRCDRYFKMTTVPVDAQLRRLLSQNIGDDSANDLMNFLATYRLAPNVAAIIADPMGVSVPREPSVNYAVVVGLVSKLTMANFPAIATYIKRLSSPYQAAFWSNAVAKDEAFQSTKEHVDYLIAQTQSA